MNSSKNNLSWIQDAILNNLLNDKEKWYTYWIKEEELPKKKKMLWRQMGKLECETKKGKKKKEWLKMEGAAGC